MTTTSRPLTDQECVQALDLVKQYQECKAYRNSAFKHSDHLTVEDLEHMQRIAREIQRGSHIPAANKFCLHVLADGKGARFDKFDALELSRINTEQLARIPSELGWNIARERVQTFALASFYLQLLGMTLLEIGALLGLHTASNNEKIVLLIALFSVPFCVLLALFPLSPSQLGSEMFFGADDLSAAVREISKTGEKLTYKKWQNLKKEIQIHSNEQACARREPKGIIS